MVFFIGIKGTGMAALACMLKDLGEEVSGSDLEKHFFTEEELLKRQIPIVPFDPANIRDGMTVIIGNAFLEDFPEVIAARNNPTCTCYRYHEYLGKLMEGYTSIAISGSHGKTTTTTMTRDVFSRYAPTAYLIGDGEGHITPDSKYLCVEADEFRRHFLAYRPTYALITNVEIDHVDYFKDEADYLSAYQSFVEQVKEAVFFNGDDPEARKLNIPCAHFSFGFGEDNDFRIVNLQAQPERCNFQVTFRGNHVGDYCLPFSEQHLLYDALAVISLATMLGIAPALIELSFQQFATPKRRFKVEKFADAVFVDDYAHHPTEVKVTLETARNRFPDKKIVAIFKPHRASRVYRFADDFAAALSLADKVYLLDFTSIDDKQDGVDIDIRYLQERLPGSVVLSEDEAGAAVLAAEKDACYVFMSSKDIYHLAEKTKALF